MPKPAKLTVMKTNGDDLSKPVSAIMSKVSDVVGVLHPPGQIPHRAPAKIGAVIGLEKAADNGTDLQQRAWARFLQEQSIQQINMEAIMARAIPAVTDAADAESVDEDWIALFFGKCRGISNEAMRDLWAKLLAAEVNRPGTFSKKTLNLLADLDRKDIEAFTLLCSFSVYSLATPVILYKSSRVGVSYNPSLYLKHGLDMTRLAHLDALGLIHFDLRAEYTKPAAPIRYFGKTLPLESANPLPVGNAAFTPPGWELARLMTPREIPEFFESLKRAWKEFIAEEDATPKLK